MNRYTNIHTQLTIGNLMAIQNQVVFWYPAVSLDDDFINFCNTNYGYSKKPTLMIITNNKVQISHKNNSLKIYGKSLIGIPCEIHYFKNRITYREGNETELIKEVDGDLEYYKKELKKLVCGLDEKINFWDSERLQGFLYLCGFKFKYILDEEITEIAYVTFPESNFSFLFLPLENHVFYTYLVVEKLKIDGFKDKEMKELFLSNNILREINLPNNYMMTIEK